MYIRQRADIFDKNSNILVMDSDRILQIYSLSVFYETFGVTREGENECSWPGVKCRGLGVHEGNSASLTPEEMADELRVVSLNVKGNTPLFQDEVGPNGPLLEGELPVELMFLRHLETLDLSHNLLRGRLFGGMMQWKNLMVLELNDNRFVSSHYYCISFISCTHHAPSYKRTPMI